MRFCQEIDRHNQTALLFPEGFCVAFSPRVWASGLDPWGVQGSAVAHQQLTGSAVTRLDRQGLVGIKNLVQGKKNRPISRAVTQAVAIPITRLPAPDLDLMGESYR